MSEEFNQEQLVEQQPVESSQPADAPVENTVSEPEAEIQQPEEVEKTYTQADLDRIVSQRVGRVQTRAEKEKAALLSQFGGQQQVPAAPPQQQTYQQADPGYQNPQQPLPAASQGYQLPPQPDPQQVLESVRIGTAVDELREGNPALFSDYYRFVSDVREKALPIMALASTYEDGVEKVARLTQTEEGRNKLMKLARMSSPAEQARQTLKMIESLGKKPDPIIPERKPLVNTNLPPSDKSVSKSIDNMSVNEQLEALRGG